MHANRKSSLRPHWSRFLMTYLGEAKVVVEVWSEDGGSGLLHPGVGITGSVPFGSMMTTLDARTGFQWLCWSSWWWWCGWWLRWRCSSNRWGGEIQFRILAFMCSGGWSDSELMSCTYYYRCWWLCIWCSIISVSITISENIKKEIEVDLAVPS